MSQFKKNHRPIALYPLLANENTMPDYVDEGMDAFNKAQKAWENTHFDDNRLFEKFSTDYVNTHYLGSRTTRSPRSLLNWSDKPLTRGLTAIAILEGTYSFALSTGGREPDWPWTMDRTLELALDSARGGFCYPLVTVFKYMAHVLEPGCVKRMFSLAIEHYTCEALALAAGLELARGLRLEGAEERNLANRFMPCLHKHAVMGNLDALRLYLLALANNRALERDEKRAREAVEQLGKLQGTKRVAAITLLAQLAFGDIRNVPGVEIDQAKGTRLCEEGWKLGSNWCGLRLAHAILHGETAGPDGKSATRHGEEYALKIVDKIIESADLPSARTYRACLRYNVHLDGKRVYEDLRKASDEKHDGQEDKAYATYILQKALDFEDYEEELARGSRAEPPLYTLPPHMAGECPMRNEPGTFGKVLAANTPITKGKDMQPDDIEVDARQVARLGGTYRKLIEAPLRAKLYAGDRNNTNLLALMVARDYLRNTDFLRRVREYIGLPLRNKYPEAEVFLKESQRCFVKKHFCWFDDLDSFLHFHEARGKRFARGHGIIRRRPIEDTLFSPDPEFPDDIQELRGMTRALDFGMGRVFLLLQGVVQQACLDDIELDARQNLPVFDVRETVRHAARDCHSDFFAQESEEALDELFRRTLENTAKDVCSEHDLAALLVLLEGLWAIRKRASALSQQKAANLLGFVSLAFIPTTDDSLDTSHGTSSDAQSNFKPSCEPSIETLIAQVEAFLVDMGADLKRLRAALREDRKKASSAGQNDKPRLTGFSDRYKVDGEHFVYPIKPMPIAHMENMNAGFVAEGLTVTKRAIDAYMEANGTTADKKALELLDVLDAPASSSEDVKEARMRLGELVDEKNFGQGLPAHPEKSPMALYGMAKYALENRLGERDPEFGIRCLVEALRLGCEPAKGLLTDHLLRCTPTPDYRERIRLLNWLLQDPGEEFLLVAGQKIAIMPNLVPEKMVAKIHKGLKKLAKSGHLDALRLLALSHVGQVTDDIDTSLIAEATGRDIKYLPEIAWARDKITEIAEGDDAEPGICLASGQQLVPLFYFWWPTGDYKYQREHAVNSLKKAACKNDLWAAFTLAYLYLHGALDSNSARTKASENLGVTLLQELVRDANFAPAKALLGLWHHNDCQNPQEAWPLLRDACMQGFSWGCEAACAHFLLSMAMLDGDRDYWDKQCFELAQHGKFGYIQLASLRIMLARGQRLDEDGARLEKYSREMGVSFQGYPLVYAWLLNLGQEDSEDVLKWRKILWDSMQDGAARGMGACILGSIFFGKSSSGKTFRDYTLRGLEDVCWGFHNWSSFPRTPRNVTRLLEVAEAHQKNDSTVDYWALRGSRRGQECVENLRRVYHRACKTNSLPMLSLLPILFKMAEEEFPKEVVAAALRFVSEEIFVENLDLRGFIRKISVPAGQGGINIRLLWKNLGFAPRKEIPQ